MNGYEACIADELFKSLYNIVEEHICYHYNHIFRILPERCIIKNEKYCVFLQYKDLSDMLIKVQVELMWDTPWFFTVSSFTEGIEIEAEAYCEIYHEANLGSLNNYNAEELQGCFDVFLEKAIWIKKYELEKYQEGVEELRKILDFEGDDHQYLKMLAEHLKFSPGGEGFEEAKDEFEKLNI
nr:hypothetical protein K-LCC10_0129 [Kaumoebavirus]